MDMAIDELFAVAAPAQVDAIARSKTSLLASDNGVDGESAALLAVSFSALEGNEWGGGVMLLDASSSSEPKRLWSRSYATGIASLAWGGSDDELLVMGCDNGDVLLQRLVRDSGELTLQAVAPIEGTSENVVGGHDHIVSAVSVSAIDRSLAASASWDRTVKLWDLAAIETPQQALEAHSDLIWDVAMSPLTPSIVATASQDCTVQLWDTRLEDAATAPTLATPHAALSLDWHPTQSHVLSVGLEDGSILTFDTRSPSQPLFHETVHGGAVHRLRYSPSHEDVLASGGDDTQVVILSNTSSSSSKAVTQRLHHHRDYVRALAWLPSTGSARIATGAWDKTVGVAQLGEL
ncbi:hypothetical protein PINS_up011052 [Pythium insidiosum]|nr:hypothetical protein PINS_up011052 [Pythium insidiosum]